MEGQVIHKPGDVVWVKLSGTWWPAIVQDPDDEDMKESFSQTKKYYAFVKFLDEEEEYAAISNIKDIYSYNCSKKEDFIKLGLKKMQSDKHRKAMQHFPEHIKKAEKLTKGNVDILEEERFTKEEPVEDLRIVARSAPHKKSYSTKKPRAVSIFVACPTKNIPIKETKVLCSYCNLMIDNDYFFLHSQFGGCTLFPPQKRKTSTAKNKRNRKSTSTKTPKKEKVSIAVPSTPALPESPNKKILQRILDDFNYIDDDDDDEKEKDCFDFEDNEDTLNSTNFKLFRKEKTNKRPAIDFEEDLNDVDNKKFKSDDYPKNLKTGEEPPPIISDNKIKSDSNSNSLLEESVPIQFNSENEIVPQLERNRVSESPQKVDSTSKSESSEINDLTPKIKTTIHKTVTPIRRSSRRLRSASQDAPIPKLITKKRQSSKNDVKNKVSPENVAKLKPRTYKRRTEANTELECSSEKVSTKMPSLEKETKLESKSYKLVLEEQSPKNSTKFEPITQEVSEREVIATKVEPSPEKVTIAEPSPDNPSAEKVTKMEPSPENISKVETSPEKATEVELCPDNVSKRERSTRMVTKTDPTSENITKVETSPEKATEVELTPDNVSKREQSTRIVTKTDPTSENITKVETSPEKTTEVELSPDNISERERSTRIVTKTVPTSENITKVETSPEKATEVELSPDNVSKREQSTQMVTKRDQSSVKATKSEPSPEIDIKVEQSSPKVTKRQPSPQNATNVDSSLETATKPDPSAEKVTKVEVKPEIITELEPSSDKVSEIEQSNRQVTKRQRSPEKAATVEPSLEKVTKIDPNLDNATILEPNPEKITKLEPNPEKVIKEELISEKVPEREQISRKVTKRERSPENGVKRDTSPEDLTRAESKPVKVLKIEKSPEKIAKSEPSSVQLINAEQIPVNSLNTVVKTDRSSITVSQTEPINLHVLNAGSSSFKVLKTDPRLKQYYCRVKSQNDSESKKLILLEEQDTPTVSTIEPESTEKSKIISEETVEKKSEKSFKEMVEESEFIMDVDEFKEPNQDIIVLGSVLQESENSKNDNQEVLQGDIKEIVIDDINDINSEENQTDKKVLTIELSDEEDKNDIKTNYLNGNWTYQLEDMVIQEKQSENQLPFKLHTKDDIYEIINSRKTVLNRMYLNIKRQCDFDPNNHPNATILHFPPLPKGSTGKRTSIKIQELGKKPIKPIPKPITSIPVTLTSTPKRITPIATTVASKQISAMPKPLIVSSNIPQNLSFHLANKFKKFKAARLTVEQIKLLKSLNNATIVPSTSVQNTTTNKGQEQRSILIKTPVKNMASQQKVELKHDPGHPGPSQAKIVKLPIHKMRNTNTTPSILKNRPKTEPAHQKQQTNPRVVYVEDAPIVIKVLQEPTPPPVSSGTDILAKALENSYLLQNDDEPEQYLTNEQTITTSSVLTQPIMSPLETQSYVSLQDSKIGIHPSMPLLSDVSENVYVDSTTQFITSDSQDPIIIYESER